MLKSLFELLALSLLCTTVSAQTPCPPFWKEIHEFKIQDSTAMPPKNAILLLGSSSFTRWKNVQDYFPGYTIINRAFGGSQLTDVIRYAYDIILPYAPRQVVVYCGENDLASSDAIKAADVVLRFKTLFGIIRQNLPQTIIHFVSLKPSPSRVELLSKFKAANAQISAFLKTQKRAGFINVYDAMLDVKGLPRKDLFMEDNLHMNESGYRIWQKILLPYFVR